MRLLSDPAKWFLVLSPLPDPKPHLCTRRPAVVASARVLFRRRPERRPDPSHARCRAFGPVCLPSEGTAWSVADRPTPRLAACLSTSGPEMTPLGRRSDGPGSAQTLVRPRAPRRGFRHSLSRSFSAPPQARPTSGVRGSIVFDVGATASRDLRVITLPSKQWK